MTAPSGIERDQGALRDAEFGALGVEFLGQRALSLGLQPGVERGRDDDVLADGADSVVEHVHDVVGGIIDRARALLARQYRGTGQRELRHRLRDVPLLRHRGNHLRGALVGGFDITRGGEPDRRLHQSRQYGRLREVHHLGALAEILLRRRLDAIGARAEIDAIEIELEDLILGIFALEPEREDRLLNFARQRALLRQEQVLRELLGERRAALHAAHARDVADDRARNPDRIDAEMRIEAAILDRDESLRQIGRQFAQVHGGASGVAPVGQQRSVGGENRDIGRTLRDRELIDRRQLARVIGDEAREGRSTPHTPSTKLQ